MEGFFILLFLYFYQQKKKYNNKQEVTFEEKERLEIITGIERGNVLPNIHISQGGTKVEF
jgi:hypothetical protein